MSLFKMNVSDGPIRASRTGLVFSNKHRLYKQISEYPKHLRHPIYVMVRLTHMSNSINMFGSLDLIGILWAHHTELWQTFRSRTVLPPLNSRLTALSGLHGTRHLPVEVAYVGTETHRLSPIILFSANTQQFLEYLILKMPCLWRNTFSRKNVDMLFRFNGRSTYINTDLVN
jgi:hypothetical protein